MKYSCYQDSSFFLNFFLFRTHKQLQYIIVYKKKEIKRKIIYMYLYTKIHLLLKASLARKIRHKV